MKKFERNEEKKKLPHTHTHKKKNVNKKEKKVRCNKDKLLCAVIKTEKFPSRLSTSCNVQSFFKITFYYGQKEEEKKVKYGGWAHRCGQTTLFYYGQCLCFVFHSVGEWRLFLLVQSVMNNPLLASL